MDECTVSNGGNKEEQRKAQDAEQRRRGAQADEIMGLSPNTHTHTTLHKHHSNRYSYDTQQPKQTFNAFNTQPTR